MDKVRQLELLTKKLEQSEKRFREFFENAPEAIIIENVHTHTFIRYNSNALKLLRLSPEEILMKGPMDMSPEFQPDGRRSDEKAREYFVQALKGEKPVFEWLVRNGEGEMVLFEVRLVRVVDSSDPEIYASFVDISERKIKEELLKSQNKKLSEIAFMQSHQVRQPVTNILGLINLFNFKDLNDPMNATILLKVKEATEKFDELIKEIVMKSHQQDLSFPECRVNPGAKCCSPGPACASFLSCYNKPPSE